MGVLIRILKCLVFSDGFFNPYYFLDKFNFFFHTGIGFVQLSRSRRFIV